MASAACVRLVRIALPAYRAPAISMCATSPSRDKECENNVRRLRKDKVFVYFT
jgi:hypothetical protein